MNPRTRAKIGKLTHKLVERHSQNGCNAPVIFPSEGYALPISNPKHQSTGLYRAAGAKDKPRTCDYCELER